MIVVQTSPLIVHRYLLTFLFLYICRVLNARVIEDALIEHYIWVWFIWSLLAPCAPFFSSTPHCFIPRRHGIFWNVNRKMTSSMPLVENTQASPPNVNANESNRIRENLSWSELNPAHEQLRQGLRWQLCLPLIQSKVVSVQLRAAPCIPFNQHSPAVLTRYSCLATVNEPSPWVGF